MNGMVSRTRQHIHSHVQHTVQHLMIALALAASVALAVAPVVGAGDAPTSHSSMRPSLQPLYTECSSTVWRTVQTAYNHVSPLVTINISEQIKADAHDGAYCGGIRTYEEWSQRVGYCDIFYATVRDASGGQHGTQYVYACAQAGNLYSSAWYGGDCALSKGWDYNGWGEAETIGGCF